jgi:hypothetical protein
MFRWNGLTTENVFLIIALECMSYICWCKLVHVEREIGGEREGGREAGREGGREGDI